MNILYKFYSCNNPKNKNKSVYMESECRETNLCIKIRFLSHLLKKNYIL